MADFQNQTRNAFATWVEISRKAYFQNIRAFRQLLRPTVELCAVIKANAYGHGWAIIAHLARESGVDSFAVHALEEAKALRDSGFQENILIMSQPLRVQAPEVVSGGFRQVIYGIDFTRALSQAAMAQQRKVPIHLKIETGTNRQGILPEELPEFLQTIHNLPGLEVEGVYTHFANIEDTTDPSFAMEQLQRFQQALEVVFQHGFQPTKIHTACSAAILLFPQTHFTMVRLGISQYGLWPSRETFISFNHYHKDNGRQLLQPVLTWKTRVLQVKPVPAGHCIGYGCTYQVSRQSRIAILPVGYADGYDRKLSNQGYVLIKGKRAPIRGRICMNLTMVDVTDIPNVQPEDEVVLLGSQGKESISAEQIASLIGTIPYEVVTRINWQLPRILVE